MVWGGSNLRAGSWKVHSCELFRLQRLLDNSSGSSSQLKDISQLVLNSPRPPAEFEDVIWMPSEQGIFTLSLAFTSTSRAGSLNQQNNLLWFKGRSNNFSMCCWMAFHNAFKTKDLLISKNIFLDAGFFFFTMVILKATPIFINCIFSSQIWNSISMNFSTGQQKQQSVLEHMELFMGSTSILNNEGDSTLVKALFYGFHLEDLERKKSSHFQEKLLHLESCSSRQYVQSLI